MELSKSYQTINNSFKRKLVYRVGIDAGFFAEYKYMLHAMLYCLQHKIKFSLYSKGANFAHSKGWTDYFEPFCEEISDDFHRIYNRHPISNANTLLFNNLVYATRGVKRQQLA